MRRDHDILKLKDKFGNTIEVVKRPVEEGDSVVVVDNLREMTLLSHIPTRKHVEFTVKKIREEGYAGRRITMHQMGGSWHEYCVYQIIS